MRSSIDLNMHNIRVLTSIEKCLKLFKAEFYQNKYSGAETGLGTEEEADPGHLQGI